MEVKCICTTTRKANRAIFRFYEDAMADSPITVTQFAILRALQRNGKTPLSELAGELVMERTSLYRTLAPLEQMKAVKVVPASKGKTKIAALTKVGRSLITEAEPFWQDAQNTLCNLIGVKKWQALQAELLKIPNLLAAYSSAKQ